MRLYNTLTRDYEELRPPDPARPITLYTCGPTVYDYAHIGNLKTFVVYDTIKRVLKYLGHEVKHALNLTDIEDKIIAAAKEQGVEISAITDKYAKIYRDDMGTLGVLPPDIEPKATETVPGMIAKIGRAHV